MRRDRSAYIIALVLATSCQRHDRTFLSLSVCVGSPTGLSTFKQTMRSIAAANGMKFVDGSVEGTRSLRSINAPGVPSPYVHIGLDDAAGNVVLAGNLGLTNRQVAIGFREGPNAKRDRAFAKMVQKKLSDRWRVEVVPENKGAFPMAGC